MFSLQNGLKQRDVRGRLCGKECDSAAKEAPPDTRRKAAERSPRRAAL